MKLLTESITYLQTEEQASGREFLKMQGRFKHLFKAGNEHMLEEIQQEVDRRWEALLKLAGEA